MKNKILSFKDGCISTNAAQYEAITHNTGPAMILAGPGSGKTFVIVHRIKYLIEHLKVEPSSILVITFTKSAAIEMQQRFMKITDSSYPEVAFGTFHSIFYHMLVRLRSTGTSSKIDVASETFKIKIMSDIISRIVRDNKAEYRDVLSFCELSDAAKELLAEISRIKNTGECASDHTGNLIFEKHFELIFSEYQRLLKEFNKIDFDDMILECIKELSKCKSSFAGKFEHILIDEYQDINLMQKKAVDLISPAERNVFVVGDDDQAIYGFRGSDPSLMKTFVEENKDCNVRVIKLEANYRSGPRIIGAAGAVINENNLRFKKAIYSANLDLRDKVYTKRYVSKSQEDKAVATFISSYKGELSDIALIFRTNSECINMATVLKSCGIPTNIEHMLRKSGNDDAVSLCLSYLEFAYNGKKRSDFFKIMNRPLRYISRDSVTGDVVNEGVLLKYYKGNFERCNEIKKLFRHINMISHLRPGLCVRYLRRQVGIDKLFPNSAESLDAFYDNACKCSDCKDLIKIYREKLDSDAEGKGCKSGKNSVKIYTMHGSKGLEFKYVWLPGLNEGIIPSRSAVTDSEIEEERRMLYVGMTRAKQALIMSYITGDENNAMLPSRFLRPLMNLWKDPKKDLLQAGAQDQRDSESSSGSSTSSSNSTSSR